MTGLPERYLRNRVCLLICPPDQLYRLEPLTVIYHLVAQCNLNCAYCEGLSCGDKAGLVSLPLADAQQVLRVIRTATDSLTFSGGEPLLYPDLLPLLQYARESLKFRRITLLTNGLLLTRGETVLPFLDRLVISLDALDPTHWSEAVGIPAAAAAQIIETVRQYASLQRKWGYRLLINAVLTPHTLPDALQLVQFCQEHRILMSISPQAINNWPHYDLLVSPAYRALLEQLIRLKQRGAPVVGSLAYLRTLRDMRPFPCYPMLSPHILPNGDWAYPCRPVQQSGGARGGQLYNLREVGSWSEAVARAVGQYGPPPHGCLSCYQQCFVDISLMQERPLSLCYELLRYAAGRRGGIVDYAPG